MAVNDLAASATYGPLTPEQLLVGNDSYDTDSAPALANFTKYRVGALTSTGVALYDPASHNAAQAVLVLQPCSSGGRAVFAWRGQFNDDLIVAYQGYGASPAAAIDTYLERLAYFNGNFRIGKPLV